MADIKLSYFDARGRAELSRLILAYAGVGHYVFLQISLFDILNETAEQGNQLGVSRSFCQELSFV